MKILVVQDYLRSGGTERQSVLLANAFAAAGHDARLLTFRPGGALTKTVGKVPHLVLQPFDSRMDWWAPRLTRVAAFTQPDIVLCMGRMANCYAGGIASRLKNAVVVSTMRTGKPLPLLFRRSLQTVHQIVANSADARDTLVNRYAIPPAKIAVIHNSLVFPADSALPRNEQLRGQYGAGPTTKILLSVAMFRPEKNQRELIEIAAGLPLDLDWQLWLAGDGPARAACEQLVAEKNLGARIKLLGFHRDPSPLYCAADLAVHASWSEALSNFLIEAQAHGLPAIANEVQGIGECFVPGLTGWIIPRGDRAAFRTALANCCNEPASAHRERATEARAFARRTFDPARQVAAYLALFARLSASS